MRNVFVFWGSSAALCALLFAGCSSKISNFDPDAAVDATAPEEDSGDPIFTADSSIDEAGKKMGCTGDLRQVIDENGVVVQTCPDDQGCAGGICVPACDAAAASKGSIGCDYVVATPSFYAGILPPCFAIFVANNWPKDVQITVQRDSKSYNVSQFGRIAVPGSQATSWAAVPSGGLPPGKVAVMFMSSDPNSVNGGPLKCPITPAIDASTALPGSGSGPSVTGRGKAWHIKTSYPVTAYDILPYGGADSYLPSAELLFPTTAWGTNYFGIVPLRGTSAPQWGQLVAVEDGTQATILPNVTLPSGTGVVSAPANKATTFNLAANEYIQWQESMEMSSTIIKANKPVSFTGGQGYDCYKSSTSTGGGCDSAHQQVPPVSAYGSEYAVPPYMTRSSSLPEEAIPYRFVGAVAGTTLTYNPAIAAAPKTLKAGEVIDFEATGAFVVKAQDNDHPFYVGQVMTGCNVTGGSGLGDEEFVNILAPAQYLTKYIFFTDPTYPTTNLVFTRVKTTSGFKDVNLDCLGNLKNWKPIGTSGQYEITKVDLIRAGVKNGTCDNGPHSAKSDAPFGIMVWGLDSYSSYAYPAGGNIAPINTVIVDPIPVK